MPNVTLQYELAFKTLWPHASQKTSMATAATPIATL